VAARKRIRNSDFSPSISNQKNTQISENLGFKSERDANRPIKTISILIFLDYANTGRYFRDQTNFHSCRQWNKLITNTQFGSSYLGLI
jgi:hypothetical protein